MPRSWWAAAVGAAIGHQVWLGRRRLVSTERKKCEHKQPKPPLNIECASVYDMCISSSCAVAEELQLQPRNSRRWVKWMIVLSVQQLYPLVGLLKEYLLLPKYIHKKANKKSSCTTISLTTSCCCWGCSCNFSAIAQDEPYTLANSIYNTSFYSPVAEAAAATPRRQWVPTRRDR